MDDGDKKFSRGRPDNLLPGLHPGASRRTKFRPLRQESPKIEMDRKDNRSEHPRDPLLRLRKLSSAARLDERLGGDASVCRSIVLQGLVELDDLPHVLSHVERRRARLALHLHLQGHVRDRGAAQQDVGDPRRLPRLRDLSRIRPRVRVSLLLPGHVRPVRRLRLLLHLRPQDSREQRLHVAVLLPRQRHHVRQLRDGVLRSIKFVSSLFQLLPGSARAAKLDMFPVRPVDGSRFDFQVNSRDLFRDPLSKPPDPASKQGPKSRRKHDVIRHLKDVLRRS